MPRPQMNSTRPQYFALEGGLDVVSPPLDVPPGRLLAAVNFEPWYSGGYRRIGGYERNDGRTRPSDATFVGIRVSSTTGLVLSSTVVTGGTSGATGTVCGIWTDDGTYGYNEIGLTKVTGTFVSGETLTGGGSRTATTAPVTRDAPSVDLEETWLLAAEAIYRALIAVVPGVNAVRGTWRRKQYQYAVRDNVGLTAAVLHLGSTSGWTTTGVTMGKYVFFTAGAAAGPFLEGETINGATSGATGVVHRVILHAGAWSGTAAGYVVFSSTTGTFQAAEALRRGVTTVATCTAAQTTFAFPVGGKYQFINFNFFGGSSTYRTYGCNGVGPAFEISETNIVSPILFPATALANQPSTNLPFLICEHRTHLFIAIPGGIVQHSNPGVPMQFNGFLGAAEFGMGDEVTGLNSVVGNVLVITSETRANGLYGTSVSDWEMKTVSERTGGKLFSTQKLDTVYGLAPLGITSISRTDAYGDFANATVSQLVQPMVDSLRASFTTSTIVRTSNQYRVYFSDGSALAMYVPVGSVEASRGGSGQARIIEFGYLSYPIVVRQIYNTEDENGVERTYFTSDDGYVYEDQIGKNFDGAEITSYIRTAFNHCGSPSYRKRFRRADLELQAQQTLSLKFSADLTYSAAEESTSVSDMVAADIPAVSIFGGGGFWDSSNWDSFLWDGQTISTARATLGGTGENIGFLIFNQSAKALPFSLQGITLHYELRRLQR